MRVAIVGLGPKGLFALERLVHHINTQEAGARIEVDAYEPSPHPGAGPVYSPDQPNYLRMNFRAEQVNLWPDGSRAIPVQEQNSFVQWRGSNGEAYPPRAEVGSYLADGLERLRRNAPEDVRIGLVEEKVIGLHRAGSDWIARTRRGDDRYDHVLICTGHEPVARNALAWSGQDGPQLIGAVFPTGTQLSEDRVPRGSTVVTRGFALSFIDAALALTEGRGGRFEPTSASTLRYVSGERDVGVLIPNSRTGRPMLAKPATLECAPQLEAAARDARAQIEALPEPSLIDDVLPRIAAVAAAAADSVPPATIGEALTAATQGIAPGAGLAPAQEMQRSVAIALGEAEPELLSALGSAWRAVYPALVARLGGTALDASQWAAFRRLSVAMERLAFGPSPENVMKLLALVEAGRVDLSCLNLADWRTITKADIVLNTVIAAPGARAAHSPLLNQLLTDGHARVRDGRRGLDVLNNGACVGEDGTPTPGLWAIGRPTEDSVIGNDTLSRTLHPAADLWARGVLESGINSVAESAA